jgi:AcrR family transcriptional regulator
MARGVNADARRREVVAQAAELFDREGYHTTNVAAIARAAGLGKPTLYHYFSGKDEILFWVHEEFIDLLIERQRARSDLSASENLLEIMSDVTELMRTHRGHVRTFFEHYRELSGEHQETIRTKRDAYQDMVQSVVERGIAAGEFRALDPRLTTLALFGMCNWAYHWYSRTGPLSTREIAEFFCDLLLEGLAATSS